MADPLTPTRDQTITLGIVVPFYNEARVLPMLIRELHRVFSAGALAAANVGSVHFVFVDDGSDDDGGRFVADELSSGRWRGSLIRLSRNFGHQAALAAGVDHAESDVVAVLDADLQDDPNEIFPMLSLWRAGADVVYGVRSKRKENVFKRAAYGAFYAVLHFLSEGLIPKDSGDFGLVDRRVIAAVRSMGETIRFFRGLRAWVGFSQREHVYERSVRAGGQPKYTFRKLYQLATDGIISSSIRPLMITEVINVIALLLSGMGAIAVMYRLATMPAASEGVLLGYVVLLVVFLLGSVVLTSLYLMSAYLGRMFLEVKHRPTYVIAARLDV